MKKIALTGTGLYTPKESISNRELVASFNKYVARYNAIHKEALQFSDEDFIFRVSGIKNRYVVNKSGILDINVMHPLLPERSDEELSIQAYMGVISAKQALENANKRADEIDAVFVAASNIQRPYPAIAVEIQNALGIRRGWGIDLNIACSSSSFAIAMAYNCLRAGTVKSVLIINPEVCTAYANFRNRDSHFILGDASTACVIEFADDTNSNDIFEILSCKLKTQYSNNIRNNGGFLNRTCPKTEKSSDKLFTQKGKKVFKDVAPMVVEMISKHLYDNNLTISDLKRIWLHQANINMNQLIARKLLGNNYDKNKVPIVLSEYANTGSAGVLIAFHKNHQYLALNAVTALCSFGGGYSVGNILLRKIS